MPRSRCNALRKICISWRSLRSSAPSGSSRRRTGGPLTIARASATRCRWPPESCTGFRSPRPGSRTRSSIASARARRSRARHPFHPQSVLDVLGHGHVREEGVVLEDRVDRPLGGSDARHVDALQLDAAGVGTLEAGDHAQRRRLARARRAEHREELARADVEVDTRDRDDVAVDAADAAQADGGSARGRLRFRRGRRQRRQVPPPAGRARARAPRRSRSAAAGAG